MTKKLLLSAAAVAAMAFAGAAGAAEITAGKISNVDLTFNDDDIAVPYAIANETKIVAANLKTNTANTNLVIGMDSPVTIAEGATVPFAVEFKLQGDAKFTAAPAYGTLKANNITPSSGVVVLGDQGKTLAYYVEYTGPAGGASIESLDLTALGITINSRSDVTISAVAKVTVAGFTQTVTEVNPTKIVTFKDALKPITLAVANATAELTDYTEFTTGTTASSNDLLLAVNSNVYADALGGTALTVANILDGVNAVVTGPQVELLGVTVSGVAADPDTLTATSGEYELAVTDFAANKKVVLNNGDGEVIEAGTYNIALSPVFDELFTGSADVTLAAIKVSLEGTNFYAPWFALGNTGANSTLRLANNGSAPVGPVIISLKANNGSAAPTGTHTIASIPAGGFVSVTGTTLKSAFGTDAANGDLQVTIQANVANVSAKVRTTQSNGQIFENSVGAHIDQID